MQTIPTINSQFLLITLAKNDDGQWNKENDTHICRQVCKLVQSFEKAICKYVSKASKWANPLI